MTTQAPIKLRYATNDDVSFIFNSWLKSYRNSVFAKAIANTVYFTEHHKIIEKLVRTSKVIVACNPEDPNQLYGYTVVGEVDGFFVMHYIYVKHSFRNMGIAKAMFNYFDHDPGIAGIYTHNTRMADKIAPRYNLIYHPYLAFTYPQDDSDDN